MNQNREAPQKHDEQLNYEHIDDVFGYHNGLYADAITPWSTIGVSVRNYPEKLLLLPTYEEYFKNKYPIEADYIIKKSDPAKVFQYNLIVSAYNNKLNYIRETRCDSLAEQFVEQIEKLLHGTEDSE